MRVTDICLKLERLWLSHIHAVDCLLPKNIDLSKEEPQLCVCLMLWQFVELHRDSLMEPLHIKIVHIQSDFQVLELSIRVRHLHFWLVLLLHDQSALVIVLQEARNDESNFVFGDVAFWLE